MKKKNKIFWLTMSMVFAFLNIISTKSPEISIILYGLEYAIIIYYTISEPSKGFLFLILFSSVTLEFDQFIYYDGASPFRRFHLFSSATVFFIVSTFVLFAVYKKYHLNESKKGLVGQFKRWIYLLGVTGVISFLIAYIVNDNGIAYSSSWWDVFVSETRLFILMAFAFFSAIILMRNPATRDEFPHSCYCILLGITGATILSILLGFRGFYTYEEIMLAPLVVCFAPCILVFINKGDSLAYIDWTLLIVLFLLSLSCPNAMGSKWYLIIFAVILYYVWKTTNINSSALFIVLVLVGLYIVPLIGETLQTLFLSSELSQFKLAQAIGMLDFSSASSFDSWFMSLDRSAQFRVDEPINIFLEYKEKPEFAFLGKGFAGTITKHTAFLDWSGPGAFSKEQTLLGVYYNMHETLAMLFLRHGVVGIIFFFVVIYHLIKRMSSPWALFALLWFLFFWTYGISFRLGAVALAIAFSEKNTIGYGKNHH